MNDNPGKNDWLLDICLWLAIGFTAGYFFAMFNIILS